MSKLIERQFRSNTNAAARKLLKSIIWMPVENRASKRMPDQHFINSNGVAGWVELKTIDNLSDMVVFQAGQLRWIAKYTKSGGHCWVAIEYIGGVALLSGSLAYRLEHFAPASFSSTNANIIKFEGSRSQAALKLIKHLSSIRMVQVMVDIPGGNS